MRLQKNNRISEIIRPGTAWVCLLLFSYSVHAGIITSDAGAKGKKHFALSNMTANNTGADDFYAAGAEAIKASRDSAKNAFDQIAKANLWINSIGENALVQIPFGLNKKVGGTDYQVAFTAVDITSSGARARVFGRALLPQTDAAGNKKALYFSGYVDLTRGGGVVSDGTLQLLGNDTVSTSNSWGLVLKGADPLLPSKIETTTNFKFDCAGFKELSVRGDVLLFRSMFTPASNTYEPVAEPTQVVSAPVDVVVSSFSSLLVNKLKFTRPFILPKVKGYAFQITEAALDFSDTKNLSGTPDQFDAYLSDAQPEEQNTWQGLVISKMDVYLPKEFRSKDNNSRISFGGTFGVIDASGFSTNISQKAILPIEKGRASGWGFSVDEIGVIIKRNELNGGSLAGELQLPIQSKKAKGLLYKGTITKDGEYELAVSFGKSLKASFWKANLKLDKSSEVVLAVKDGAFRPKVILSGSLSFNSDGKKDEDVDDEGSDKGKKKKAFNSTGIAFEEMMIQTESPYFSVKAFGVEGTLSLASFEAEYSVMLNTDVKKEVTPAPATASSNGKPATTVNQGVNSNTKESQRASLRIALDIKLMDGKIGGKTDFSINALYNESESEWQFDNIELNTIGISADFGKVKFSGELDLLRDDDVYGNAFAGNMKLKANKFELKAKGIFGTKDDFRYWSVDGSLKGFKLQAGPITFTGFSGGASYKMDLADKESPKLPSGIAYIPSKDAFLRVRAGVLFDVVQEKVMTADAGFEIVFNQNWGVNQMLITGNVRMLSKSDNKGDQRMKNNMRKFASKKASSDDKEDASIWGSVLIKLDFENDVYNGDIDAYVNFWDLLVGNQGRYKAGRASFYASSEKWNILVGTKSTPISLKMGEGGLSISGSGYFMMGSDMKTPYGDADFAVMYGFKAVFESSMNAGWLYADFKGSVGYDIQLLQKDNFMCNGKPAGMNGWYGGGRIHASFSVSAGIRVCIKIGWGWFSYKKCLSFSAFRGSLDADLEIRGPRPLYFSGDVTARYSVGWGPFSKSGSFSVSLARGTACTPPPLTKEQLAVQKERLVPYIEAETKERNARIAVQENELKTLTDKLNNADKSSAGGKLASELISLTQDVEQWSNDIVKLQTSLTLPANAKKLPSIVQEIAKKVKERTDKLTRIAVIRTQIAKPGADNIKAREIVKMFDDIQAKKQQILTIQNEKSKYA